MKTVFLNSFFDNTDENGMTNREKISKNQKIIRRVATTDKNKSYEEADGKSDGVVVVDGKVVGFGIHIFNDDIYPLQSFEIYLRNCDLVGELDLTECSDMLFVDVYHNRIGSVNVSGLRNLRILGLQDNRIGALYLDDLESVLGIDAGKNRLKSVDVSKNVHLVELYVNDNDLSELDLSNNSDLKYFYCHNNRITALDTTNNPLLRHLNATGNPMTEIKCYAPQREELLPLELRATCGGHVGLKFNPIYNAQWKETGEWEQVYYAYPCEGYKFAGWRNADGDIISNEAVWTDKYGESRVLTAVFERE